MGSQQRYFYEKKKLKPEHTTDEKIKRDNIFNPKDEEEQEQYDNGCPTAIFN